MENISLEGKTNFFEKRVAEYQKAGVIFDVFVNPTKFEKQAPHPKYWTRADDERFHPVHALLFSVIKKKQSCHDLTRTKQLLKIKNINCKKCRCVKQDFNKHLYACV